MKCTTVIFCVLVFPALLLSCAARADEKKQSADSSAPALSASAIPPSPTDTAPSRSDGFDIETAPVVNPAVGDFPYFSLIDGYKQRPDSRHNRDTEFDRYEFFDGTKLITIEGRLRTIDAHGTGSSAFQVMKTYEALVKKLGGVKVFEGKSGKMYDLKLKYEEPRHRTSVFYRDDIGVYVVRMPDREIWVETFIAELPIEANKYDYFLTVVEKKNLDVKATLLTADEMKKAIDAEGHVALYINFDFDKADIRQESQPIIGEIVSLLKNNPELKLIVEGHTDNVGKPEYNKQLSDKRAKAVAAAVAAKGIDPKRLDAVGLGQDKPIADNSTDDGRAKNRRVELVDRSAR